VTEVRARLLPAGEHVSFGFVEGLNNKIGVFHRLA
jgi:hypothetical protein